MTNHVVSVSPKLLYRIVGISLFLAIVFGVPGTIQAADLWVDRNSLGGPCDDGRLRAEVGEVAPWCTLKVAGNNVQPGDVVHVRAGEYTERHNGHPNAWGSSVLQMVVSGTINAPIKFMAEPGESVVLTSAGGAAWGILVVQSGGMVPRYIEIEGFVTRDFSWKGVMVKETSDVVLHNLEVTNCTEGAIGVLISARVTVEGCKVHHNSLTGWTSPINYWRCGDGNVIRGNFVWANTDEDSRETEGHGIILDNCEEWSSALIENNVIWENEGLCMNIYYANGATVRNNTCWQNNLGRTTGTVGELWLRGEHVSAHNNVLVSRGYGPALRIANNGGDMWTVVSDHNILWSPNTVNVAGWPQWNSGTLAEFQAATAQDWDTNSIQVDPQLFDPPNAILRLTRGSPAVDSGDDQNAPGHDAIGFVRPHDGDCDGFAQVDRGAYEFGMIFFDDFESGDWGSWSSTFP